jgi:sensor histidine kinase regulating citrate/malate metabolism
MTTTKPQMILVAVLVCMFAVGMAGFLNYFKYRSNAERILRERLVVTGNAIETNIQSSLALGLNFSDIGTLQATMDRERATDDLILSIEVFDTEGKPLYSTDRLRAMRNVPAAWLAAAQTAHGADWFVKNGSESAAGTPIQNNFGLPIGFVALRYSEDKVNSSHYAVARELALSTVAVFVAAAFFASMALLAVMRKLARDLDAVEAALRTADPQRPSSAVRKGPFGHALRQFFERVRGAEAEIALLRRDLERGAER